jgi:hypothetical protein
MSKLWAFYYNYIHSDGAKIICLHVKLTF